MSSFHEPHLVIETTRQNDQLFFGSMYVVARGVHVTKFRDMSSVNSWFPVLSPKTEEM